MYTPFSFSYLISVISKCFVGVFGSEDFFRCAFDTIISSDKAAKFPNPDSASISRWINGKRALPKEFVQLCLENEEQAIRSVSGDLKTYADKHLFNLDSAVLEIVDAIRQDTTIDYTEKEIFMHSTKDADPFGVLASALLLSVKLNRTSYVSVAISSPLKLNQELWASSQRDYSASHSAGGRFHSISIIQKLLPQGYISDAVFPSRGKTEDGNIAPLMQLCAGSQDDIAIVGDGGIGKTTFLQQLLLEMFTQKDGSLTKYELGNVVPFFIELNRCPDHISEWYNSSLRKTNFITRYIGQMKENHASLDSVSDLTLDIIEKELQKIPSDGKPQYLLLLDGFNEVRTSNSVRTHLSNEIAVLHSYPNVRIITTSRETQSAYYASEFTNVRLIGLMEDDIISYLEQCNVPEPVIGNAMANESLLSCLKIPLYLCMFTASSAQAELLPETAGEILYNFFHRNTASYNVRNRADETRTNQLTSAQTAFILDFVLPYIGWVFENRDTFSLTSNEFESAVRDVMVHIKALFLCADSNPFSDFGYQKTELQKAYLSFYMPDGELLTDSIIACVFDYLGIVYRYTVNEGDFSDRIRYAFCHHHFRDYFSAMWDVQLLSMLQCIQADQFNAPFPGSLPESTYQFFLNSAYWQDSKVAFISEILMEHRSRPLFNSQTGNWMLPKIKSDEQKTLPAVLDFCRKLCKIQGNVYHFLQNILSTILIGRKEFSGLDLSNLNLAHCSLFNITCSRLGRTQALAARFDGSTLTADNFTSDNHLNSVMEYVYHENLCFTIDDAGVIKCWDVRSGKLEYELHSEDPLGVSDFSRKGFTKISNDGHWLATKVQETSPTGVDVYINLFDLTHPELEARKLSPEEPHNLLTFFGFTEDSKGILALFDRTVVCCFDISTGTICDCHTYELLKQTELYAYSLDSVIYAYTAEYDTYQTEDVDVDYWDADESEEAGDEYADGIFCRICKLTPTVGKTNTLYDYCSSPHESPTILFVPSRCAFLLFNYENKHIELFDCEAETVSVVLEELTALNDVQPSAYHQQQEYSNLFYILYPDICFTVDIDAIDGNGIIMKYPISGIEKLIPHSDLDSELAFKPNVAPSNNRFVVGNDTNTYEWDAENDTLSLRYNSVYYNCIDLFAIPEKQRLVLVHTSNGISIFGGEPIRLVNQFCFYEPGYLVESCCYDALRDYLVLTFARPDHEKVIMMRLSTGEQHMIFSTLYKGESILNVCFSPDSNYLLITSQYRCLEYSIHQDALNTVCLSGSNERFAMGSYRQNEIEIAVVEHMLSGQPRVEPRCDYFVRTDTAGEVKYLREWYYLIPEITDSQTPYFIYRNGDFGIEGSYDVDGFQTYWVTSGFFLEKMEILNDLLRPKCFRLENGTPAPFEKEFQCFEMIVVKHSKALANQYRSIHGKCSYMHLADDWSDAILTEGCERLSYAKNLKTLTYKELQQDFQRNLGDADGCAYWDFATPWTRGVIGCLETYRLIPIDMESGELGDEIEYTPGIAIQGCSFRNAALDEGAREIILQNGGKGV